MLCDPLKIQTLFQRRASVDPIFAWIVDQTNSLFYNLDLLSLVTVVKMYAQLSSSPGVAITTSVAVGSGASVIFPDNS